MIRLTRILADYLVRSKCEDLLEAMTAEAVRATINWLGCACSGSQEETVSSAMRALSSFAGPQQATVIGRGARTHAPTVALINGLANCVHSFNDTHPATIAHPTGPVAATLFAQAELKVLSGGDFLHALILGMEIECRLASMIAALPALCSTGISTLGVTAPFGAAAAVSKVIGLDEQQMVWALGLAATMASGLQSTHASMASLPIPGHGARCGFMAAHMAATGFTATERSLESCNGYAAVFSDAANFAAAVKRLGEHYEVMTNRYKPYPCGVVSHPAIDACLDLAGQAGFDAKAMETVELEVHPLAQKLADRRDPKLGMEALVSPQHRGGPQEARDDKGQRNVDQCIGPRRGPPDRRRAVARACEECSGSPGRPMLDADLEQKFRQQALLMASEDLVEEDLQQLWNLRSAEDTAAPLTLFAQPLISRGNRLNTGGSTMERAPALYIDGEWTQGATGARGECMNPATGHSIGTFPHAKAPDIERALEAAQRGFKVWSKTPAHERSAILRKASDFMRQRAEGIAELMTLEQGKTLTESRGEALLAPEHTEWCAEEGRRAYGRVVPARAGSIRLTVLREPVGPVAAFAPWNFPVNQSIRKIASALAAGCSIILKGPEEAPSCTTELVRCFHDAGLPKGVLNLLFGVPAEISQQLIASPVIRKVSFTGSVAVGKHLAALAGQYMKRTTMELGGHAPVLVFNDFDPVRAAEASAALKFRNAGQSCISPSRFFVQEDAYDAFVERFATIARSLKVGDGMDPATQMGPLAASRRVGVMEEFVSDAVARGAVVEVGGKRVGNGGYFFAPTVLRDVPDDARIMREEPFGPVAPIVRFKSYEEAVEKANSLELGLAAYAFTASADRATLLTDDLQAGLVSINGAPLTAPETPFGGIKDSGYGSEGGIEGLEPFLITKLASQAYG